MTGKKKPISAPYYNIGQLRVDYWNKLKNETADLARSNRGSGNEKLLITAAKEIIFDLRTVEQFFAFPGVARVTFLDAALDRKEFAALANYVAETTRQLVSDSYRSSPDFLADDSSMEELEEREKSTEVKQNYFEVLFVENMTTDDEKALKQKVKELRDPKEQFTYGVVVQRSFQDALIALLFNQNIQAIVVRYAPPYQSKSISSLLKPYIQNVLKLDLAAKPETDLGPILGKLAKQFRPELDTYYVTDTSLDKLHDSTIKNFNRIFYLREDLQELHLMIIRGIRVRYETPFFTALKEYSQKPTGVFHAMPISRGNSVFKSRWIKDFGDFYGRNMFLAETSATTGGLDSLLQPQVA